jgi:hypothetical protein
MAESPCCGSLTKPEDAAAIARTSIYSLWPIIHQDIERMELFSTISTFSLCVNDSQSKHLSATSLHPGTGTIKFRHGDLALAMAGAQQNPSRKTWSHGTHGPRKAIDISTYILPTSKINPTATGRGGAFTSRR